MCFLQINVESLQVDRTQLKRDLEEKTVLLDKMERDLQDRDVLKEKLNQAQTDRQLLKDQEICLRFLRGKAEKLQRELTGSNAESRQLQATLREAQTLHGKARQELDQIGREKLSLQGKVENLLQELNSAKAALNSAKAEQATQKDQQGDLRRLHATTDDLRAQLVAAEEVTVEMEAKHESETTNYKIKLELMEREKDTVLDRMTESQEAELERLRTLNLLRDDLQRESHLNAENLLNESAIKHKRMDSSKADELVQHLKDKDAGEVAQHLGQKLETPSRYCTSFALVLLYVK